MECGMEREGVSGGKGGCGVEGMRWREKRVWDEGRKGM